MKLLLEPITGPTASRPPDLLDQVPAVAWSVDRELKFTAGGGLGCADLLAGFLDQPADLYSYFGIHDPSFPPLAAHLRALQGETGGYAVTWNGQSYQCRVAPIRDAEGRVTGAAGIAVQACEAPGLIQEGGDDPLARHLRETEGRSRTLLASLPQRIFFKDRQGAFIEVNDLFARDFGLSPAEMVGRTDYDFFAAELAEKYRADDLRIVETGETETLVESNVIGTARRVVEVVKKPVVTGQGEVLGILGVFTDITERERMQAELAYERHLLHTLLDNIPDLIYFKDKDSRFTRINRAHAAFLDLDNPAQAVGLSDRDFYDPEQAGAFRGDEEQIFQTGCAVVDKIELSQARFLSTTKMPIFQDGEVVGLVGVSRDVTDRIRADLELKKAAEELRRSNEDLQQFAYVASHDLQEPLRMVSSYTQLLARRYKDRLDDDANEFIEYAVDGARRMHGLINDLLRYSRVGTRGVAFHELDLNSCVREAAANLQTAISECEAALTCDPLPVVEADAGQMMQLFQNLLGNALKFRGEAVPVLHIAAERAGDEWVISVHDNGIGIEPQYAERIFVIFQRLHAGSEFSGSGIGLAICKKIVGRHGGRIWMEPNPHGGSVFRFTLPLHRELTGSGLGADQTTGACD